jgi:pimeloyl-ACP methyl ester carboxylesterase
MPYVGDTHYLGSFKRGMSSDVLILIHGAGGSCLHWPPNIRRLSKEGVLAVDLPGHGKSAGGAKESISENASFIIEFLDRMGIDQAVLGGHSMGSAITQWICLENPERVKGLILVGAGAKLSVNPQLIEDCNSEETFPRAVARIIEWSFSQQSEPKLVRLASERLYQVSPDVLLADFIACNNFDLRNEVKNITQPTLIICGEADQMTPVRFSECLAGEIMGSRLEIIPQAGHMVMLEQANLVAGLFAEFFDSLGH